MLTKEQARSLIPLVNNLDAFALLTEYVDARIENIKESLLHVQDIASLERLQGAYTELYMLKNLKKFVDTDKV
jgi:hypothetical protein